MIAEEYYLNTNDEKILTAFRAIKKDVANILSTLGLDITDPSIMDTPKRVAKMLVLEICSGLFTDPPKITTFPNINHYDEMLIERNIKVHSTCEHHLLPFIGVAHVSYIPSDKLIGLSKINRIVDYYARRPQLQERLTNDIGKFLQTNLNTENVAVVLSCKHLCTVVRGVKDENNSTVTSFLGGNFRKPEVRAELLTLIGL